MVRHLDQQPASCGHCGQRYTWEWGSQIPLLITSRRGESLFDFRRFRSGIRHSVRKLPGTALIWSDEKLIASAASSALVSATPYIRQPNAASRVPSIDASDLEVTKEGEGFTIIAAYQRCVPLLSNVSVCIDFEATAP